MERWENQSALFLSPQQFGQFLSLTWFIETRSEQFAVFWTVSSIYFIPQIRIWVPLCARLCPRFWESSGEVALLEPTFKRVVKAYEQVSRSGNFRKWEQFWRKWNKGMKQPEIGGCRGEHPGWAKEVPLEWREQPMPAGGVPPGEGGAKAEAGRCHQTWSFKEQEEDLQEKPGFFFFLNMEAMGRFWTALQHDQSCSFYCYGLLFITLIEA